MVRRLPPNELGAAVCQFKDGRLILGPVAHGTPNSVQVPLVCPSDSELASIFHTHPGGIAYPSQTDIDSTIRAGLDILCIQSDIELKCFRLLQR